MPRVAKKVWFLVVPGAELLDVSDPWEVFGHANDLLGWSAYQQVITGPSSPTVCTRHGLSITGVVRLPAQTKRLPDLVIVAGGSPLETPPPAEAALAAWLRRHHARIPALVSICTGAFILGQAVSTRQPPGHDALALSLGFEVSVSGRPSHRCRYLPSKWPTLDLRRDHGRYRFDTGPRRRRSRTRCRDGGGEEAGSILASFHCGERSPKFSPSPRWSTGSASRGRADVHSSTLSSRFSVTAPIPRSSNENLDPIRSGNRRAYGTY